MELKELTVGPLELPQRDLHVLVQAEGFSRVVAAAPRVAAARQDGLAVGLLRGTRPRAVCFFHANGEARTNAYLERIHPDIVLIDEVSSDGGLPPALASLGGTHKGGAATNGEHPAPRLARIHRKSPTTDALPQFDLDTEVEAFQEFLFA